MRLDEAYAHCGTQARERARERWLAALFAPAELRPHLHALIAFELEMSRMREMRDPRAGEIRLVWWREALSGARDPGHPVAAATLDTLQKFRPPPHLIENAVSGRQFDLYDDPFATIRDLEAYLGETRSGLLQIAAIVLGGDDAAAEASGLAGVALGLADCFHELSWGRPIRFAPSGILAQAGASDAEFYGPDASPARAAALRALVSHARSRCAEAEAARAKLPRRLAPAYAGLATAPLRLAAFERQRRPPSTWRRQWALWRWMRRA